MKYGIATHADNISATPSDGMQDTASLAMSGVARNARR